MLKIDKFCKLEFQFKFFVEYFQLFMLILKISIVLNRNKSKTLLEKLLKFLESLNNFICKKKFFLRQKSSRVNCRFYLLNF